MFNFFSKGRKILFTGSKRWPKSCSREPEKECSKVVVISAATIVAAVAVVLLVVVVVVIGVIVVTVVTDVAIVAIVAVVVVVAIVAAAAVVAVVSIAVFDAVVIVVNDTDLYNSNETSRDVTKFFLGMFTFNNDTVEK